MKLMMMNDAALALAERPWAVKAAGRGPMAAVPHQPSQQDQTVNFSVEDSLEQTDTIRLLLGAISPRSWKPKL